MGASSSKEEKLQSIKRKLLFQVEYNKNKLKLMNDELTKMEMKIEIGEADIAKETNSIIPLFNYFKNWS